MFEDKPKPAEDSTQANLAAKLAKKKFVEKVDKDEVKRLKKKAESEKFTQASYKAFSQEVEAVTWQKTAIDCVTGA